MGLGPSLIGQACTAYLDWEKGCDNIGKKYLMWTFLFVFHHITFKSSLFLFFFFLFLPNHSILVFVFGFFFLKKSYLVSKFLFWSIKLTLKAIYNWGLRINFFIICRYVLAIAILSTLYAGAQALRQVQEMSTGKQFFPARTLALVDFFGDQVGR